MTDNEIAEEYTRKYLNHKMAVHDIFEAEVVQKDVTKLLVDFAKEITKELTKENVELKKQQFSLRNERNTFLAQNEQYEKDLMDFNDKLTEAKDLIRNLLRVTYGEGWNYSLDWKVKAEQFLKEE